MLFPDLSEYEHVIGLMEDDADDVPSSVELRWSSPGAALRKGIHDLELQILASEKKHGVVPGTSYQAELLADLDWKVSHCRYSPDLRRLLPWLREQLLKAHIIQCELDLGRVDVQMKEAGRKAIQSAAVKAGKAPKRHVKFIETLAQFFVGSQSIQWNWTKLLRDLKARETDPVMLDVSHRLCLTEDDGDQKIGVFRLVAGGWLLEGRSVGFSGYRAIGIELKKIVTKPAS